MVCSTRKGDFKSTTVKVSGILVVVCWVLVCTGPLQPYESCKTYTVVAPFFPPICCNMSLTLDLLCIQDEARSLPLDHFQLVDIRLCIPVQTMAP